MAHKYMRQFEAAAILAALKTTDSKITGFRLIADDVDQAMVPLAGGKVLPPSQMKARTARVADLMETALLEMIGEFEPFEFNEHKV